MICYSEMGVETDLRCAFIGLGAMGEPLALRAIGLGHPMRVRDLDAHRTEAAREAGATVAGSIYEAVADAQVVMICLPSPAIIDEVVAGPGGIVESMAPGTVVIDFSTHSATTAGRVEAAVVGAGGFYLHTPVTGGPVATLEGKLVILVGGEEATLQQVAPLLEGIGGQVVHVGTVAAVATAKLVNNLLALVNTTLFMEGFALAAKAGIPAQKMYDILAISPGFSRILERRWRQNIAPRNFEPGFSIELAVKDLELIQDTARELGVPVTTGAAGIEVYRRALEAGRGRQDVSALVEWFEELLGVEIRAAPAAPLKHVRHLEEPR